MPYLLRVALGLGLLAALATWVAGGLGLLPRGVLPFHVERWTFAGSEYRPASAEARVDPTFAVDPERAFEGHAGRLFRLVTAGRSDFPFSLPDHVLLTDEAWGSRRRLLPRMERGTLYDQRAYWYEEDGELVLNWSADVPILAVTSTAQPDGTWHGRAEAGTCVVFVELVERGGETIERERPRPRPHVVLEPLGDWPR